MQGELQMMFENILKKLAMELVPKLLPDLLRSLADQIEQGAICVPPEIIAEALEAHEDHIKAVAAEMAT